MVYTVPKVGGETKRFNGLASNDLCVVGITLIIMLNYIKTWDLK